MTWLPRVLAATDCTQVTEIPQLECEALIALYDSTNGHRGLVGTIPRELGNLSQLKYLYLNSNQLSGNIPKELGNLNQLLKYLYLNDNQLSGSIPSELGNLNQLKYLYLNDNQLIGSIPSELRNLSQLLKYLYLNNNQLSGSIPSELGNLSQLGYLFLSNNQLSGDIPPSLSHLQQLSRLDLGYNYLTASDPQLISFLDQKDPDWAETQNLPVIRCGNEGSIGINPLTLDFGSEAIDYSNSLTINTRSQGCGDLRVDTIEFTGNHATEFTSKNKYCQEGESQGQTFSSCQFTLVFSPTSAGIKEAVLNFTFNDDSVIADPMQLLAIAVDPAQLNLAISPISHDFGTITLGRGPFDSQIFTLTNTGNVNLKFETIALTGTAAAKFSMNDDCSHKQFLRPEEQCQISVQFMPLSLGEKPANLHLTFRGGLEQNIPLSGKVTGPADCSEANITITSVGSGAWDSTTTWNSGTLPTTSDVVQINSGHTITAIPFAQVKALGIETGGRLESLDNRGTRLEIQKL